MAVLDTSNKSLALMLLLLTYYQHTDCLNCYQCDDVLKVSDCQSSVTCFFGESCFTDTTGTGFSARHTLGCRQRQSCSATANSSTIAHPLTPNLVCSQCCDVDLCNNKLCVTRVNGEWSSWSPWSECSSYCTSTRTRTCSNPAPSIDGKYCMGKSEESKDCIKAGCSHITARLSQGTNSHNGNVQFSIDGGQWGAACDIGANTNTARAVCNMLGLPTNTPIPYGGDFFGPEKQFPLPKGFSCGSNSTSLADCARYATSCSDDGGLGVWCGDKNSFDVRLVNGTDPHNGRLEVSFDGNTWGSVCNYNVAPDTSEVICKMLGFPTNFTLLYKDAHFGSGTLPNILTSIFCRGSEQSLDKCTVGLNRPCGQSKEVGVACSSYTGVYLRLVDGPSSHGGRLEASVDGTNWGTVCDDYFNTATATVVCKTLGLPWLNASKYSPPSGTGLIMLDDVKCDGSETNIADCKHRAWGTSNCRHDEDVGVTCA